MAERRILIVDDDPQLRETVTLVLHTEQYQVHAAASGKEGLAQAAQLNPDLIILDVNMPDMEGFEVVRELRRL